MSSELDRQGLVDIFVMEASEAAAALSVAVNPPGDQLPSPEELQNQYVWAHKVRGAAAIYGYAGLSKLGELLEATLEGARSIEPALWPQTVGILRGMVEAFQSQLAIIKQGGQEDMTVSERWKGEVAAILPRSTAVAEVQADEKLETQYLVPVLDADVLSYFAPEADEYLETMGRLVQQLRGAPGDHDTMHALYRTAHTLKGSAHTIGFKVIGDVAHPVEDCMIAAREGQIMVSTTLLSTIDRAVQVIRVIMRRDESNVPQLQRDVPDVTQTLRHLKAGEPVGVAPVAMSATQPAVAVAVMESPAQDAASVSAVDAGAPQLTDEYLLPQLDPEVLSYFAPEAQEYLESLEAQLLRLEKDAHNQELIHQLFRTAHTLKGSAYTVGFQSIGDLTHYVEDFMGAVREGRVKVQPGHADMLLRAVDVVRLLMRRDPMMVATVRQRFATSMAELKQLEQPVVVAAVQAPVIQPVQDAAQQDPQERAEPDAGKGTEAKGKETGEDREVIRVSRDRLERLLNLVGELVIGRGRLEQRLRVLEQLSQQVLGCKNRLIESVRTFEEKHMFTLPSSAASSTNSEKPSGMPMTGLSDFGTLEFDKYDDFNILARRISEVTADISESMSQLSGSIRRSHEDMSQLQQLTLGMRDEIARARMVPIGTPFTRFRRATREMARATGKEVTLITSGEHTEVDTGVVERLVDPLVHLVRNAVYHGIEPAAVRLSKGKPAAGTIYLHAAHRGSAVLIEVEDDGAGLDIEKIRTKAVERGLVRADIAKNMPDSEVIKFIFMPGFSTADQVGDQAGRGVGMDVVKRVIESMNGHIDVESMRGVGTKFTLHLPLTLLIATALMVRSGNERYGIPLPSIREVTMASSSSLQQIGDRRVIQVAEDAIEVQLLHRLLNKGANGFVEVGKPVVIVRTGAGPIGIAVDELLGRQEIVIKPIGSLKSLERSAFCGATIDPEGRVVLVLDPARLVSGGTAQAQSDDVALLDESSASADSPAEPSQEPESQSQKILLVDDSLSIRKFVGRMLETAGYEVDTAVDGEEGLRKASAQNYRLILTDLEMPKLNGYEVIQALRSRPQTQHTPIIVMTTRAGDKHRQMAISIGASSYIAKPVEERALIQELERWLGQNAAIRRS